MIFAHIHEEIFSRATAIKLIRDTFVRQLHEVASTDGMTHCENRPVFVRLSFRSCAAIGLLGLLLRRLRGDSALVRIALLTPRAAVAGQKQASHKKAAQDRPRPFELTGHIDRDDWN
jgi:hypothetical protein